MKAGFAGDSIVDLRYLKYLRCFCGSEAFSACGLEKEILRPLVPERGTAVETGILVCEGCKRAYPVIDGVAHMLPEALDDEAAGAFLERHSNRLPDGVRAQGPGPGDRGEPDRAWEHKRNEMKARDEQAGGYHGYLTEAYASSEQRAFMKHLRPAPGDAIVELGCGTGKITTGLVRSGAKNLVALDFSEASIRLLRRRLDRKDRDRVFFVKGDACNPPFRDGVFDKCVSAQVFEHIPGRREQERFVAKVRRILKPGGAAALTVYNSNLVKRLRRVRSGYHAGSIYFENFTKKEVRGFFEGLFTIERLTGMNCYFPFFHKAGPRLQKLIESCLCRSPFNGLLGNILFLGVRAPGRPFRA